jgi:hypothetical protein
MNTHYFGGNPYDNQDFLREQFLKLSPQQHLAAFLAVAEKYYRSNCSGQELGQTVERINRQYERALIRISTLERELRESKQPPAIDEAA